MIAHTFVTFVKYQQTNVAQLHVTTEKQTMENFGYHHENLKHKINVNSIFLQLLFWPFNRHIFSGNYIGYLLSNLYHILSYRYVLRVADYESEVKIKKFKMAEVD